MSPDVVIAVIMALPPTLAVILGFLASRRSVQRSVGTPLIRAMGYLDAKMDRLAAGQAELREGQAEVRERLARLEGEMGTQRRTLWAPP